ncbi:MAG TPA: FAD-dependent hydroxylase [Elainellaceae cyanobacterium]
MSKTSLIIPQDKPSSSGHQDSDQSLAEHPRTSPLDYDIAIVGGGIVGLTFACALKNAGLKIALIEALSPEVGLSQHRSYAITLLSGQIFSGLGVWDEILPQITTFRQIRLADADYSEVVTLLPDDLGTDELGYVAEHRVLLKALQNDLEGAATVSWLCPAEVVGVDYQRDRVEVTISADDTQHKITAALLVAADGSRSRIRHQAGIRTQGWAYWQSCVTAVIRPECSHHNVAREHFWSSGPFASLPLSDNRYQIVLTAPHDQAKALLEMDEQAFLAELDRRYDGKLGTLTLLGDRVLFPVQLMHSSCYSRPRLVLIGDAAHSCHPVGGQGLNLGIRDAAALAQVLQTAHEQGEDIGQIQVLRRYERWRRLENWLILGFTDALNRCFSNRWSPLVILRHVGLWTMRRARFSRYLALRLMTGSTGRSPKLSDPQS